jgi:hypothetical protein
MLLNGAHDAGCIESGGACGAASSWARKVFLPSRKATAFRANRRWRSARVIRPGDPRSLAISGGTRWRPRSREEEPCGVVGGGGWRRKSPSLTRPRSSASGRSTFLNPNPCHLT